MMTREHHRRRSPESSRRRRKERRDSREQLHIQPVPLPITRYEERDDHHEEQSRAFSPLSTSSSTSSSLLNISRPSQRFGLGKFFGGGQKQHRVKKKRRFLKFGNSSSSSVGSDLAYGKGYIEKGRSREFSPPTSSHGRPAVSRRSQTDEEILELGRKFAEIARQQNAEDLRAAGRSRPSTLVGAAAALSHFRRTNSGNSNRGIGSSRPLRDSSPDDSEWESASDDDGDSSSSEFDSGLAYGSGLSLQASAAPPPPQSPKSPPRLLSSPRSLISPQRSPPLHRKPSVVDPNLFGPVNSLHGYVETPCGFEKVDRSTVGAPRQPYEPSIPPSEVQSETRPLQRLYPIPTSDPSNFDAGGSVVSSQREFPTRARPAPVPIQPPPIQQPRPIAPVSRKVLDSVETDSRYSERSLSKSGIGEAAIAGVAGAAIGAALSSDRRDDRDKRESRRERDGKRRSRRSDAGVHDERSEKRKSREDLGETREVREVREERVDRRQEKRSAPDRESEKEKHWREKIVPELKRESEEKRRRDDYDSDHDHDNVRDKRADERKGDREISRREVRREEKRDERRGESRTNRSTSESYKRPEDPGYPSREGPIDPFQFQVADDAFPTPLYTTPKRPLTPNVVTVEREPDFSRFEYREEDDRSQERLSRRDSYERELRDAHDIYEATEHATAPVSGAAFAAATAAVLAEERRGRSRSRGGDASSRNRSHRSESPKHEKDTVLEDANRYYREAELARRIKEEEERSRANAESSVVDKWQKSERKKPAVEIVQPPEMDHPKKKSPYDGPDADVRIDNVLQHPSELSRFQAPIVEEGLSEPPLFKVRDPSAERERPMLNIVRPTPVPSPMPEEKWSTRETPKTTEEADVPSPEPTPAAVTEPRTEASPAPPTPKVVSWGENQTKHYVVESPEREDDPYSGAKIVTPAKTPRARRRSTWEKITAAIGGANDEATSSGVSDRSIDTDPTKPRRSSEETTSRRSSTEIESTYGSPPIPGPKPSSLRGTQIPGSFAEDPVFTANIAAALEGSGFDPNIVIDNPSFHRRDSPPGSNESGAYQSPYVESVTDLGTTVAPRPAVPQEHGFVIGEVSETPSDEKDIPTDNSQTLSEPSRRERRKQEKVIEREGYEKPKIIVDDKKPSDTSRSTADDDWDPASGKLSKKERKRRDRAARNPSPGDGIALDDASRKDQELEAEFMGPEAVDDEEDSSLKKKSKKSKRAVIVQGAPKQSDLSESSKVIVPVDAFRDIQDAKDAERPKITIPVNAYQDVQDAKTVQLDDMWDPRKSEDGSKHDPEIYDLLSRSVSKPDYSEESTRDLADNKASSIPDEERGSPRKNNRRSKRDSGAYGSPSRPAPLSELSIESSYRVVDTDSIPAADEEWDTPRRSRKKSSRDSEIFGSPSRSVLVSEPSIELVRKDTLPDTTSIPGDDQDVSFKKRDRRGTIDEEFVSSPSQSVADWNMPKELRKSKLDSVIYDTPPRVDSSEDIVESPKEMSAPFSDWRSEKTTVTEEEPSTPKKSKKKSKRDSTIHEDFPSTPVSRSATPSVASSKKSKRDSGVYDSPSRSATASEVGADVSPKKGKKKKKRPSTPGDFPHDDGKPGESEPPDLGKDQVEISDRDIGSILSDTNRYDDQRLGKGRARFDVADDDKSIISTPSGIDRKDRKSSKSDKDKKSGGNSSFFERFRSSIGIAEEKERSRKSEEDKKNSFLDNADTLGAGVGSMGVAITPSPQESRSNAINAPLEEEAQIVPSTPEKQSILPLETEFIDPEIAPREIRPAIDPKYGDLLPLPPSRPGSPVPELSDNFPDLPESRPETPEHERHLREIHSHVRRRSAHETPTTRPRTPSQSAIPISFRLGHRHTPSNGRSSPLASPIVGNSEIGSEPRSRSRPISWEGAREFKPLLLLQRASRGSIGSVGSLEISSSPERESPLRDVSPSDSEIREHRSQSLRRLLAESPDRSHPVRDNPFITPTYAASGITTPGEPISAFEHTHADNPQTPDDGAVIKLPHEFTHLRDVEIDDHHLEPVPEQPVLEAAEDAELPMPLSKHEPTELVPSSDELSPLTAKRPSDIHFPPSPSTTAATQERRESSEIVETPLERNVEVVVPKIEMTEPTPRESDLPITHDDGDLNQESEFVDSLEALDKDMLGSRLFTETEASKSVDTLHTALSHFEDDESNDKASLFEPTPRGDEKPQETQSIESKNGIPTSNLTNVNVAQIQEEPRRSSRILEQLRAAKQAKESTPVEKSAPVKQSPPAERSLPAEDLEEEVQQTSRKADNSDAKQAAPSPFQPLDQGGWLSSFRSSWRSGLLPRPWQLPKATDNKDKENDTKSGTAAEAPPPGPPSLGSREEQPLEETPKEITPAPEPEPEPEVSIVQEDASSSSKKSKKKKKRKSQIIEPSPDQPIVADAEDTSIDKTTPSVTQDDQPDRVVPLESLDAQHIATEAQDTVQDKALVKPTQDSQPSITQEPLDVEPIIAETGDVDLDELPTHLPVNDEPNVQSGDIVPQEPLEVRPAVSDARDLNLHETPAQLDVNDQQKDQPDAQLDNLTDAQVHAQSDAAIPEESLGVQSITVDTQDTSPEITSAERTEDAKPQDQLDVQTSIPSGTGSDAIPQESPDVQLVHADAQDTGLDDISPPQIKDQPDVEPIPESDVQLNIQPDVVTQEELDSQPAATDIQDIDLNRTSMHPTEDNSPDVIIPQESRDAQSDLIKEVPTQEEVVVTEEPAEAEKELNAVEEAPALELNPSLNEPLSKPEPAPELATTKEELSIGETGIDAQKTSSTTESTFALVEPRFDIESESLAPRSDPTTIEAEPFSTDPESIDMKPVASVIEEEPARSEPETKEAITSEVESKETTNADSETVDVGKEIPPVEIEPTVMEPEIPSSKPEPIVEPEPTVGNEPAIVKQVTPITEAGLSTVEVAPGPTEKESIATNEEPTVAEDDVIEPPASLDPSSSTPKKEKKKKKKKGKKQQSSENDQAEPATPLEESVQLAEQPTQESNVEKSDGLSVEPRIITQDEAVVAGTLDASLDKTPDQPDQLEVAVPEEPRDVQPSLPEEIPSTPKKSKKKKKGKKAQNLEPEPEAETTDEKIPTREEDNQPLPVESSPLPIAHEAEMPPQSEDHRPRGPPIGDVEVLADHAETEQQPIPPTEEKSVSEDLPSEKPQAFGEFGRDEEISRQLVLPDEPVMSLSTEPNVDNLVDHQPALPSEIVQDNVQEEQALSKSQAVLEEIQLPSEIVKSEELSEFSIPHDDPRIEQQHDEQHTSMETSSESPVVQDPKSLEQVNVDESPLQPNVLPGGEQARDGQVPASIAPLETPLSGPNSTEGLQETSPEQIVVVQDPSAESVVVGEPQSSSLPTEPAVEQLQEMALPQEEPSDRKEGKNEKRQDASESVDTPMDTDTIQDLAPQITPLETIVDELPVASDIQEKPSYESTEQAGDNTLPEPTKSSKKSKKGKKKRQKSDATDLANEPEGPKADTQVPEPISIEDDAPATVTAEPTIESAVQPEVVAQVAEEQAKDITPILSSEDQEPVLPIEEPVQPSENPDDFIQAINPEEQAETTQGEELPRVEELPQLAETAQLGELMELKESVQTQDPIVIEEPPQPEPPSDVERSLDPEELTKVEEPTKLEEFMQPKPTLETPAEIEEVGLPNETTGDVIQGIDSENQAGPIQIDEPSKLDESLQPTESTQPETSEVSKPIADQAELADGDVVPQDGSTDKYEEKGKETRQTIDAPASTGEPESSKSVEELTAVETDAENRQIVDDFRIPTSDLGPAAGDQLEEAQAPEPESTPSKKQAKKDKKKKKKKRDSVQDESVAIDTPEDAPKASDAQLTVDEQSGASNEAAPQFEPSTDINAITEDTQVNEAQDGTEDKGVKTEESKGEEEQRQLLPGTEETPALPIVSPEISAEPSNIVEESEQSKKETSELESTPTTPKKSKKDKKKKKRQSVQLVEPPEQSTMEAPIQPDIEFPQSDAPSNIDQVSAEVPPPPELWSKPENHHDDRSIDADDSLKTEKEPPLDEAADPLGQPTEHVESEQKSDVPIDEKDKPETRDTEVPAMPEDSKLNESKDEPLAEAAPNNGLDNIEQQVNEILPADEKPADKEHPMETIVQEPAVHDEPHVEIIQSDQDNPPAETSISEVVPPRDETEPLTENQTVSDALVVPQVDEPTPIAPIGIQEDQPGEQEQIDRQPIVEESPAITTDAASPEDNLPEVSTPKKKSKKKKKRASQVDVELESGVATPSETQDQELQAQPILSEEPAVQKTAEQPESQPIVEESIPMQEEAPEVLPVVSPSKKSKKERRKAKKLAEAEAEAANNLEAQRDLQEGSGLTEPTSAEGEPSHVDQPTELPSEKSTEQPTEPVKPTSEVDLPELGTTSEDIQREDLQLPTVNTEPPTHSNNDRAVNVVKDTEEETTMPVDQEQSLTKSEQDPIISLEPEYAAKDVPMDKAINQTSQPVEVVESTQEADVTTIKSISDSQDIDVSTRLEEPSTHVDETRVEEIVENIEETTAMPIEPEQSLPRSEQDEDSVVPHEPESAANDTNKSDATDAVVMEAIHEQPNDLTGLPATVLKKDEKDAEADHTPKIDNQEVPHLDSVSQDLPNPEDEIKISEEPLVVKEQQQAEPSDIPEPSKTSETKDIEQGNLPTDQDAKPDVTIATEPESQPASPVSRKKSKRDKKKKRASAQSEPEPVSGSQTPSNQEMIPSGEPNTTTTTEPSSQEPGKTELNEGEWIEFPAKSKEDKNDRKATGTSTPMESMEGVPANAPSGTMREENAPGKLTQEEILEVEGHSSTKEIQEEPSPNPENQDENAEDFNISHLVRETIADSKNDQLAPPTEDEHRAQRDEAPANEPAQDIQGHVELSTPISPPRTPLTRATPTIDIDLSPAQLSSHIEHDRPFDQSPQPGKKARTHLSSDDTMIPAPLSAPPDASRDLESSIHEAPELLQPPDQHMTGTEESDVPQQDITPAREIAASFLESQSVPISDKDATAEENPLIEQTSNVGLLPAITPQREIAASYLEERLADKADTDDNKLEGNAESVDGGVHIVLGEDTSATPQPEPQPNQQVSEVSDHVEEMPQSVTPQIANSPTPVHDAAPSAREIAANFMESRPKSSEKQIELPKDSESSTEDEFPTYPAGGASLTIENPNDSTESMKGTKQRHVDERAQGKEDIPNDPTLHEDSERKSLEGERLDTEANAEAGEHTKAPSPAPMETKISGDILRQDSFPENIESPVVGREVQRDLPEPRDSNQEIAAPREPPASEIIKRLDDLDTSENIDESSKPTREPKIDNALLKSLSPRPTLDYSSSGRNSPRVSLPPVEEETREEIEKERRQSRARDGSKRSSITIEPNRDSGFSTDSPHPKRRSLADPSLRDSGVHLRDWTEGEPKKAVEPPEEEQGSALRTPQPNEKRSKKLGLGSDTPKLETPVTRSQEDDAQPITDPKKLSRSSSKTSKSYGDLGQQVQQQRSVSDNISRSATPRTEGLQGLPQARRSASNTSISRFSRTRTPDPLRFRPDSPGSYTFRSGNNTPPLLRRVDRRMSGDLRSLSSNLPNNDQSRENIHSNQNQSTSPIANEGRVRAKDMTDVYDGYGEGRIGSPRSPTRPQSMRRRQSMQVLELESRVEQLIAENRALADAKLNAEQNLNNQAVSAITERDAEIESLKASLEWLRKEVTRLTEINEGLHSANNVLALKHTEKYGQLESRHASTSKELEEFRSTRDHFTKTLEQKDAEIQQLRAQLEATKEQVREMQQQILASKPPDAEFLRLKDEDHFDHRCQQLCSHVQQWVLRFSKFSDMRACRLTSEINDEKIIDRLDNSVLDGSDVDTYLSDRVRRRDIFMSMTMNMIWEFVFTRYLFGMDREQRQKLKSLEKLLQEVGPPQAVRQWRAVTLTLLSKRPAFGDQRNQDTEAVVQAIFQTLCMILPPPSNLEAQIQSQLRRVMREAVDLSIEMRTQRAEYMMLPPLQPEYDANGDLARTVSFNAALMNERSGDKKSNDQYEAEGAIVRTVLFPLVVKKGDDNGVGDEEIVICPAQVLVAKPPGHAPARMVTPSSDNGGAPVSRGATPSMSVAGQSTVSVQMQDAPLPMPTPPHERDYI